MRIVRLFLLASLAAASAFAAERVNYIFQWGDRSITLGGGTDIEQLVAVRKGIEGNYIWYRADGATYLIRDRDVLAQAKAAFAPVEALDPEYEALRARMRVVEQRESELDHEIDRLTDRDDETLTAADRAGLRRLESEMREVQRALRPIEQEERRLDQREEALEKVAEAEFHRIVRRAIAAGVARKME